MEGNDPGGQSVNPIIGGEYLGLFEAWLETQGEPAWRASRAAVKDVQITGAILIPLFCRWLVETGDGDVALKRINGLPRQLWLDFGDRGRWVVDKEEDNG